MIKKAKSISQLYEETKQFDLVITNDAPLNTALNKQIDKPHLGNFALTSRLLGSKYGEYFFEQEQYQQTDLVLHIQKIFKLSLKEALNYTKNIVKIWQYTGDINQTKKYLSKQEQKIAEYIQNLPLYQNAMEKMDIDLLHKQNIITIGEEIFTNLDKRVLTKPTTKISPFTNQNHKLDTIYLFDSQNDIVERVNSMINKDNQNNVAIVLNIETNYLSLIKSKLINKGIQLNETLYLNQEFSIREYLLVIEICNSMHNLLTKEVIPIANLFNIELNPEKEKSLFLELTKYDDNAKRLYHILQEIKEKTFGEIVSYLKHYDISFPEIFKDILKKLDLLDEKITISKIQKLKYFIENIDEETEKNKSGVLLVDAKNSAYINRDIIFYIGMDQSWTKTIDNQNYINKDEELDKNIKQFEILIQQGIERFFFVPKITQGEDTIPPYYFNFLFEDTIEKYSEDFFQIEKITNAIKQQEKNNQNYIESTNIEEIKTLSASSLNNFSQCPKKYFYSNMVSTSDNEAFLRGNIVHSFAEFYITNNDFVKSKELDEFVEISMNHLKLFSNPFQNNVLKTKIKSSFETIIEFIDRLKIDKNLDIENMQEFSKKTNENIFANYYQIPMNKSNAEIKFKDYSLKLDGVIDLLVKKSLIVDYKTSKDKKKVIDIMRKSNINNVTSDCDFQPLVYLSKLRKINPNQNLEFWYQFPMCSVYEKITHQEVEDSVVKIHYISTSFNDFIKTDFFNEYLTELLGKDARNILNNYNSIDFFNSIDLSQELIQTTDDLIKKFSDDFLKYHYNNGMKDNKGNNGACLQLLKYILGFKKGEPIGGKSQKEGFFFKEDLDAFEEYVEESINQINTYLKTNFPYNPVEGEDTCENCDFKKICLKKYEVN